VTDRAHYDSAAHLAARNLEALLDRDLTYVGNVVELRFESHHEALNSIAAARLAVDLLRRERSEVATVNISVDEQRALRNALNRSVRFVDSVPVGRTPERPADLVPLANGSSVDLGGHWTLPT
jgi:hypothetical protein